MKKYLGFCIRLSITITIILYIVNYLIVFEDQIFLKTGKILSGEIQEFINNQCKIKVNNKLVFVNTEEMSKDIEFGFLSITKNLNKKIYFLFSLLLTFNIFLNSWRLRKLLQAQDLIFSYKEIVKISFISTFFGNFLPGFTGGDLLKVYYISQQNIQILKSTIIVLFDRVIGLIALVWVATFVMILHLNNLAIAKMFWFIFLFFTGSIVGILCLFFLPIAFFQHKYKFIDQLIEIILVYRKKPIVFLQSLFISFVIHCSTNIAVYGFSRALGLDVPMHVFFVYVPIGYLVMMLPISLAGWGVGEATYSYLFSNVGIAKTQSITMSILLKISQMIAGFWGGILWLSGTKQKNK